MFKSPAESTGYVSKLPLGSLILPPGGGGGTDQNFIRGGSTVQPVTLLYTNLTLWLPRHVVANHEFALDDIMFRNVKYSKHVTYSTFLEGWGLPTLNNLSSLQDPISVLPFYSEGTGIQFASTNGDGLHLSYTIYSISLQPYYS